MTVLGNAFIRAARLAKEEGRPWPPPAAVTLATGIAACGFELLALLLVVAFAGGAARGSPGAAILCISIVAAGIPAFVGLAYGLAGLRTAGVEKRPCMAGLILNALALAATALCMAL